MSVSLGEFHTLVADSHSRGTSLTAAIALRTKLAANWIERNYTFQYMRQWKELTVSASATYPYIISLANVDVKRLEVLRIRTLADDDSFLFSRPLNQVSPADRESRPVGNPESYWLNGRSSIILNSVPDEDLTLEAHGVFLTRWGVDDAWTHWLLDNATELLLARTLMMMCSRTRDPDLYKLHQAEFDLEIKAHDVAEEALQSGDFVQVWEPPEHAQIDDSLRSA